MRAGIFRFGGGLDFPLIGLCRFGADTWVFRGGGRGRAHGFGFALSCWFLDG
jgi:hypothetical protein